MNRLICCAGCSRHMQVTDHVCPFCQRTRSFTPALPNINIPAGLSRAQRLALAAAMASQALASCAQVQSPDGQAAGANVPGGGTNVMIAPPYGLPPPPPPIAGHPSDGDDAGPSDRDH